MSMFRNNKFIIEIKVQLLRAGKTQASIARELGVNRSFVNNVIKGHRSTKRVREAIAKAVGKRVNELWPSGPLRRAA
jgi:lambda repressor-like predicted transcriptional regulator